MIDFDLNTEVTDPKKIFFDNEDIRLLNGTFKLRNFKLKANRLSQDFLRSIYYYDPIIGRLRYLNDSPYHKSGDMAGYDKNSGYRFMKIKGIEYPEHNIMWIWHFGAIPFGKIIDHRNQIKNDNRIINIAPATYGENARNLPLSVRNDTGVNGLSFYERKNMWRVRLQINYEEILWGFYHTHDAGRLQAIEAQKYFGFSPIHGVPNSYEMRLKSEANMKKWKERRGEDKLITFDQI